MTRLSPDALTADRDLAIVISVTFAGRTWRLGTRTFSASSSLGAVEVVAAIDSLSWSDEAELAIGEGIDVEPQGASVSAYWPGDVARLVEDGHPLDGAPVEVALADLADSWDDRVVLLTGVVADPVYGRAGEPVTFTADASSIDEAGTVLAVPIDESTHLLDADYTAELAPVVFGAPGYYVGAEGESKRYGGSTAYTVQDAAPYDAVIAGHHVQALTVSARDEDAGGGWVTSTVNNGFDNQGNPIAGINLPLPPAATGLLQIQPGAVAPIGSAVGVTVDILGVTLTGVAGPRTPGANDFDGTLVTQPAIATEIAAAVNDAANDFAVSATAVGAVVRLTADVGGEDGNQTLSPSSPVITATGMEGGIDRWKFGNAISISWRPVSAGGDGGGLLDADGGYVDTAGELLTWLLRRSTVPVDLSRCLSAVDALSWCRVSGSIEEQCTPLDWIRAHLLPILPVALVSGPRGLYPLVTRWEATTRDAVTSLDADRDLLELVGGVTVAGSPASELSIDFARDVKAGAYLGREGLTGAWSPLPGWWAAFGTASNVYTRASLQRHGRRTAPTLQSDIIVDRVVAQRVLAWRSAALWTRHRQVAYTGPREVLGWLQPGDVVTLSHGDLHLTDRIALVQAVSDHLSASPTVRLTIREAPPGAGE
jgi:hypothetical protein